MCRRRLRTRAAYSGTSWESAPSDATTTCRARTLPFGVRTAPSPGAGTGPATAGGPPTLALPGPPRPSPGLGGLPLPRRPREDRPPGRVDMTSAGADPVRRTDLAAVVGEAWLPPDPPQHGRQVLALHALGGE